jgi:hypothetical protein
MRNLLFLVGGLILVKLLIIDIFYAPETVDAGEIVGTWTCKQVIPKTGVEVVTTENYYEDGTGEGDGTMTVKRPTAVKSGGQVQTVNELVIDMKWAVNYRIDEDQLCETATELEVTSDDDAGRQLARQLKRELPLNTERCSRFISFSATRYVTVEEGHDAQYVCELTELEEYFDEE